MDSLLLPPVKELEDSKKDFRTRISDRRRPMAKFTMRLWAFLKDYKKSFLLSFVITMITVLLLSLAAWMQGPVVAPCDDLFEMGG